MRVGRDEAVLLLEKWLSEERLLKVDLSFPLFAATFRGRIFRLAAEEFGLVSEDRTSELVLRLAPGLKFGYGDARGTIDAETFEGTLIVFFRLGNEGEDADFISLTEIIS